MTGAAPSTTAATTADMGPDAAPSPSRRARVLLIAGSGRSGSTLLANLLASVPGTFGGGEMRYLFERGLTGNRLCGCGAPFRSCPVWAAVLGRAFPGSVDAPALSAAAASWGRIRQLPRLLAARPGNLPPDLAAYAAAVGHLYEAIPAVTGASLIVDSSKLPAYGRLLDLLPGIDLTVLHLVRDPRAAAYSWSRHKPLADGAAAKEMERISPLKSAVLWDVWNLSTRAWWGADPARYLRVPYEAFLEEPRAWAARALQLAGHDGDLDRVFAGERTIRVGTTHTVAGNPDRLRRGEIDLRLDDEWSRRMSRRDRAVVTAMTAPLRTAMRADRAVLAGKG